MNITRIINKIYPNLSYGTDYRILNNGKQGDEDYIEWYNTEIPEPTQQELDDAWVLVQQDMAEEENKENIRNLMLERRDLNRFLRDMGHNEVSVPDAATYVGTMFNNKAAEITTRIAEIDAELLVKEQSVVEDVFNSFFQ